MPSSMSFFSNGSGDIEEEETMDEEYDHEKFPSGKMTMYFGSQTGTAESFAKLLSEQVQKLGLYVKYLSIHLFMNSHMCVYINFTVM